MQTAGTLHCKFLSVSEVLNHAKHELNDKKVTEKRYANVFMQNKIGEDLFDAVTKKAGGSAKTERAKASEPPWSPLIVN